MRMDGAPLVDAVDADRAACAKGGTGSPTAVTGSVTTVNSRTLEELSTAKNLGARLLGARTKLFRWRIRRSPSQAIRRQICGVGSPAPRFIPPSSSAFLDECSRAVLAIPADGSKENGIGLGEMSEARGLDIEMGRCSA